MCTARATLVIALSVPHNHLDIKQHLINTVCFTQWNHRRPTWLYSSCNVAGYRAVCFTPSRHQTTSKQHCLFHTLKSLTSNMTPTNTVCFTHRSHWHPAWPQPALSVSHIDIQHDPNQHCLFHTLKLLISSMYSSCNVAGYCTVCSSQPSRRQRPLHHRNMVKSASEFTWSQVHGE